MKRRTMAIIAGAVLVGGLLVGGATVALGSDDDDGTEQPITGVELEQATDAALTHLGEGTVTETEIDDEESKYEVEVTLEDGTQVDVQLDENFEVVGTEADDDSADGEDSDD